MDWYCAIPFLPNYKFVVLLLLCYGACFTKYFCRDILAKMSNDEAYHYGRKVRLIVRRLRAEIIDVNEEMKALNRS